jgi:hypothetical protein
MGIETELLDNNMNNQSIETYVNVDFDRSGKINLCSYILSN